MKGRNGKEKKEILNEKAYKEELLKIRECGNINKYDSISKRKQLIIGL